MTKFNAANERVKHRYLHYLKDVKGGDDASIDGAAKAIHRFEEYTKHRDFKRFHIEQARGFKAHLGATRNARTGEPLSASTTHSTLAALKAFFSWLAQRRGYRAKSMPLTSNTLTRQTICPASPPPADTRHARRSIRFGR
jgi:site-specific recombinase XerD